MNKQTNAMVDKDDRYHKGFCFVCQELTPDKDCTLVLGKNKRFRMESSCVECNTLKSRFISNSEAIDLKDGDTSSTETDSIYGLQWRKQFHLGLRIRKNVERQRNIDVNFNLLFTSCTRTR